MTETKTIANRIKSLFSKGKHAVKPDLLQSMLLDKRLSPFEQKVLNAVDIHNKHLRVSLKGYNEDPNTFTWIPGGESERVVIEFFNNVGLPAAKIKNHERLNYLISNRLEFWHYEDLRSAFNPKKLPTDGLAFEQFVADGLRRFGWMAVVTTGSGDQGVDIVAHKNGKNVGIQCKLLKKPTGNKAVQEAFAGLSYWKAGKVVVMSNTEYTKSAKELAIETGVGLTSPQDIPRFFERVFGEV